MSDEFDYESLPGSNPQTLECLPKGKIRELKVEIARLQHTVNRLHQEKDELRAALEEITRLNEAAERSLDMLGRWWCQIPSIKTSRRR